MMRLLERYLTGFSAHRALPRRETTIAIVPITVLSICYLVL